MPKESADSVKLLRRDFLKAKRVVDANNDDKRYFKYTHEHLKIYLQSETLVKCAKALVDRLQKVYDNTPSEYVFRQLDRSRWQFYFAMTGANRSYKSYNPQAGIGKPFSDVLPYPKSKMRQGNLEIKH